MVRRRISAMSPPIPKTVPERALLAKKEFCEVEDPLVAEGAAWMVCKTVLVVCSKVDVGVSVGGDNDKDVDVSVGVSVGVSVDVDVDVDVDVGVGVDVDVDVDVVETMVAVGIDEDKEVILMWDG